MKKTLKSILAAALVIIMALSSVTAFAAETNGTIEWNQYGNTEEFSYAGELKEGTNSVPFVEGEENLYYNFTAEKDGYYFISYNNACLMRFAIAETFENGIATDTKEYELVFENELSELYHLEKGSHIVGALPFEDTEIKVEYYGDAITDLIYDEGELQNHILDDDAEYLPGKNEDSFIPREFTVVFSSGKTIKVCNSSLAFTFEDELVEGENAITVEFLDYSEAATATFYPLSHYIKDIELTNLEKYLTVKKHYDSSEYVESDEIADESLIVTYADGTTITINIGYRHATVPFPNGRYYSAYIYLDSFGQDEYELVISLDGNDIHRYPCTKEDATVCENTEVLNSNIKSDIDSAEFHISNYIYYMKEADSLPRFLSFLKRIPEECFETMIDIFINILTFIRYYNTAI